MHLLKESGASPVCARAQTHRRVRFPFNQIKSNDMKFAIHLSTPLAVSLLIVNWPAQATEVDLSKLPPPADRPGITFAKDIQPLLEASCVRCHGAERPKAGLQLTSLEGVLKGSKDGKVVVPGNSKDSALVLAVSQLDEEKAMPPKFKPGRRRPGGPGGPGGQGGPPPGGPGPDGHPDGPPPGGGAGGPPGGMRGGFGPPPKPLTAEQVGLVRAWIDQGAK